MKFRKKPVVIEAVRLPLSTDLIGWGRLAAFMGTGDHWRVVDVSPRGHGISINTLEGTMTANPGDWIIKGVKGEFYPCKPDIFEATYEPVT